MSEAGPSSYKLPEIDATRRLSDVVYQSLRDAITDGSLERGARLREVAIARQMAVSPTPVREALRRLEREGLVETTSHRGASVAAVSAGLMANLYEIHETLEAFAVRCVVERGPHALQPLDLLLDQIDASLDEPDQRRFNRLDIQFHRALNAFCGNPQMADLIEQTHRRIQAARVRLDIHLPDRPRRSQDQHRALLDAVRRGAADDAETIARQHITAVRNRVLSLMEGGPHQE